MFQRNKIFLCILICFVIFGISLWKQYDFTSFSFPKRDGLFWRWNSSEELCLYYLTKTSVISFNQLLLQMEFDENKFQFAVIVPDGVKLEKLNNEFCYLIQLLENNEKILMAAGNTVMPWKPVCTLTRNSWTVKMSYDYGRFETGFSEVSNGSITCYACDLLPDIFVIKLNELSNYRENFTSLVKLHKSAHLPFFTLFIGRSAYCPAIHLKPAKFIEDFSCNNLSSRWDEAFAYVPAVTNILRLISPSNLELWLGCMWHKKVYVLDLPIYCSNFVRQYLFDIVDILENNYKLDYRVVFGTLLGAARGKDVIPWTPDIDLYVPGFNYEFEEQKWSQLPKYSSRRYSRLSKDFSIPIIPARAIPMCPVLLSTRSSVEDDVLNANRNILITKFFEQPNGKTSYDPDWKNFGYVDVYVKGYLGSCVGDLTEQPAMVEIHHKFFKTVANVNKSLVCEYGENFMTDFPDRSLVDWEGFI